MIVLILLMHAVATALAGYNCAQWEGEVTECFKKHVDDTQNIQYYANPLAYEKKEIGGICDDFQAFTRCAKAAIGESRKGHIAPSKGCNLRGIYEARNMINGYDYICEDSYDDFVKSFNCIKDVEADSASQCMREAKGESSRYKREIGAQENADETVEKRERRRVITRAECKRRRKRRVITRDDCSRSKRRVITRAECQRRKRRVTTRADCSRSKRRVITRAECQRRKRRVTTRDDCEVRRTRRMVTTRSGSRDSDRYGDEDNTRSRLRSNLRSKSRHLDREEDEKSTSRRRSFTGRGTRKHGRHGGSKDDRCSMWKGFDQCIMPKVQDECGQVAVKVMSTLRKKVMPNKCH